MPVFLRAPQYQAGGPDGRGWNRLSLNAHMGTAMPCCALRPRTYAALTESHDTRKAAWGGHVAACIGDGMCGKCRIYATPSPRIPWEGQDGKVLVRIQPSGFTGPTTSPGGLMSKLWAMQTAEGGWDARAIPLTWEEMAAIDGWTLGSRFSDEHSDGFWIVVATVPAPSGQEGTP